MDYLSGLEGGNMQRIVGMLLLLAGMGTVTFARSPSYLSSQIRMCRIPRHLALKHEMRFLFQ